MNPLTGLPMSSSHMDIGGNVGYCGRRKVYWDDYDAVQPPLSEREQQEATERIARTRAELNAKFDAMRNMAMFAFAVIIGLITAIFIAPSFF
jgi:hypothetical protein